VAYAYILVVAANTCPRVVHPWLHSWRWIRYRNILYDTS